MTLFSILIKRSPRNILNARFCSNDPSDLVIEECKNGIRILTMNRPGKMNSLNLDLYQSIPKALNDANSKSNITVLRGSGTFYSSGNDLMNFAPMFTNPTEEKIKELAENSRRLLENFVSAFIDYPGILVAVVNGPAIGISATTLALCDVVFAVNTAYFRTPFTKLGQSPEGCSSYLFPKLMGSKRATEVLLLDKVLTATEAKEVGLVTEVFPPATFGVEVDSRLKKMSQLPAQTMLEIKNLTRHWEREKLHQVNKTECDLLLKLWQSRECHEAMINFSKRRK